jgi:AcrR family transcriptional regulator
MSPRNYSSPVREAASEETRTRILAAAGELLGTASGAEGFSLDAVARRAGVTRPTVYAQFGSRRALLEAVFDETAARGGLHRLAAALNDANPHRALGSVVSIFCEFWQSDTTVMRHLNAAAVLDPELGESFGARNERRRVLLRTLLERMNGARLRSKKHKDLCDVLFALTSLGFFLQLQSAGREAEAVEPLVRQLVEDAVERAGLGRSRA